MFPISPTEMNARSPKKRPLTAVLLASCMAVASMASLNAENAYWTEYGSLPIYVEQNNYGKTQTLKFVEYQNESLVAELEMPNPDGTVTIAEVSQPATEGLVKTLSFKLENFRQASDLAEAGNLEDALELMRPEVYPLVKFYMIPESFAQLHQPIRSLIDTLVNAGEYAEAEDLVQRIALDQVSPEYSFSAVRLMNAFLLAKDFDGAARMAERLPVHDIYTGNIMPVINTADALRGAGQYDAVIPLYQDIKQAVPEDKQRDIDMWLAYSLVLADRLEEGQAIIDSLREPKPKEKQFSLYKLLQGSNEYRRGNFDLALDTLTRGFVRAQTSYSWVPEMMFLIGDCYRHSGDITAARNVWTEITILYPDVPWADRSNESLAQLPAVVESDDSTDAAAAESADASES